MMQASFASAGVRRNVLARIAAGGPGLGAKTFNVKSVHTSCAGKCAALWRADDKLHRRLGLRAGKQSNPVPLLTKLFRQPGYNSLDSAVELRGHRFRERCDERDAHLLPLHPEELLVWQCAERAKVPDVFIAHII